MSNPLRSDIQRSLRNISSAVNSQVVKSWDTSARSVCCSGAVAPLSRDVHWFCCARLRNNNPSSVSAVPQRGVMRIPQSFICLAELVAGHVHDIMQHRSNSIILLNALNLLGVHVQRHFADERWSRIVNLNPRAVWEVVLVYLYFDFYEWLVRVPESLHHRQPETDDVVGDIAVERRGWSKSHLFMLACYASRFNSTVFQYPRQSWHICSPISIF